MRKRKELADPSSCLNRAKDGEMIFVLLGRDVAAVAAVRAWIDARIKLRRNHSNDQQILDAMAWIAIVEAEQRPPHACDCELRNRQWNAATGQCETCGGCFGSH